VIGAGEPAIPGISIGHNGAIAFGVAIFPIDQEDLYIYDLHPDDDDRYRYQGGWEQVKVVHETVPIRSSPSVAVELRFTRHGPVIRVELDKRRAFAVRSCWLEPGTSPYLASMDCMRARSFGQFRQAVRRWGAPGENLVYADDQGNIGCVSGGLTPIRPNWDGLLPVPGDGRYEWAGFLDGEALPCSYNPPEGWIATANQMNLPADFPHRVGFEWVNGSRYDRIAEVLGAVGKVSLEDSMRLQNDVYSVPGRRLARLLAPLQADEARARMALEYLRDWNFVLDPDNGQAALAEVWLTRHLRTGFKHEVLTRTLPPCSSEPIWQSCWTTSSALRAAWVRTRDRGAMPSCCRH
jgi:penicillin amidase